MSKRKTMSPDTENINLKKLKLDVDKIKETIKRV